MPAADVPRMGNIAAALVLRQFGLPPSLDDTVQEAAGAALARHRSGSTLG